jgi:DNA-binding winged helix-turn-helix (wHTH) protein/Tfp pilus assembly protein PilF
VFDLLVVLVEGQGRILSKEELLKAVWPDTYVEEGNLTQNISVLRKALAVGAGIGDYIDTAPRQGYRFIAPVRNLGSTSEEIITVDRTRSRTVIEEETSSGLARSTRWVIAVAAMGLIAAFGVIMWQAGAVGGRWSLKSFKTPREGSNHNRIIASEAQDLYNAARDHEERRDETNLAQAIAQYQRVIELQPDFAAAYAGLARSWLERGIWGAVEFRQSEAPAQNAARKALELDPDSADAHAVVGHVSAFYHCDWPKAEREYRRAIELDPNNVFAHRYYAATLEALGRFPESIDEAQRALALGPVSSLLESAYARHLFRARKFDESIRHYQRAIELDTRDFGPYTRLAEVYEQTGRFGEAVALIEKALRMQDAALMKSPALARAYALAGRRAEALEILTYVTKSGSNSRWAQDIALSYFALGDRDHGFEWLAKAFDQHQFLIYVKVDPRFDSVREDWRFQSLVRRLGLPVSLPGDVRQSTKP